jgi:hypothetical protein
LGNLAVVEPPVQDQFTAVLQVGIMLLEVRVITAVAVAVVVALLVVYPLMGVLGVLVVVQEWALLERLPEVAVVVATEMVALVHVVNFVFGGLSNESASN